MKSDIVEKYACMWPREVFDITQESEGKEGRKGTKRLIVRSEQCELWKRRGVYVLYRDDHPYYIGRAGNLAGRIWRHANHPAGRYYLFWNFVSAFVVRDERAAREVEGILIAAMPTANSATPRIRRVKLPRQVTQRLRTLRKQEVHPVTDKGIERMLRRNLQKAVGRLIRQRQADR
jgi:hypothetical protein